MNEGNELLNAFLGLVFLAELILLAWVCLR